jgi:transposase
LSKWKKWCWPIPTRRRLIADAQIKTDRLDAHALGTLLRGNPVARAHGPRRETRVQKNLLRQRLYWARFRTMLPLSEKS